MDVPYFLHIFEAGFIHQLEMDPGRRRNADPARQQGNRMNMDNILK